MKIFIILPENITNTMIRGGAKACPICRSLAMEAIKYPKKVAARHSSMINEVNYTKLMNSGLN